MFPPDLLYRYRYAADLVCIGEGGEAMEDQAIIALYWQRDEYAITESETKYGAYCNTIAGNILHSPEDSAECVNDTFYCEQINDSVACNLYHCENEEWSLSDNCVYGWNYKDDKVHPATPVNISILEASFWKLLATQFRILWNGLAIINLLSFLFQCLCMQCGSSAYTLQIYTIISFPSTLRTFCGK